MLCYLVAADFLLFHPLFLPLEPPPPILLMPYPVLRYFLLVPPNSRLFRHSYILVSSSRKYACSLIISCSPRGRFRGGWKLTALLVPFSLPPSPSPALSPGDCTRLTRPLLRQITSTTRRPFGIRVLRPRLPYSTLAPPISSLAPAVC